MPCSRRGLLAGALLTLAGCGSPATAPPSSQAASSSPAQRPVVGLTYIPNIQFAPLYWAVDRQQYQPPVTLRHHGEQEGLFTALLTGQEQLVVAGGDEMLQARAETGAELVAVASVYRSYPVRLVVLADSPISSVADLRGRTVGLPGRYGENWFALKLGLIQAGLSESTTTILEIGYTQQAALVTRKVDAVVGFVNGDAVQLRASGTPVRVVTLGDLPLVSASLITTAGYAQANPDLVAAITRGSLAGMRAVAEDPAEAVRLARRYVPGLAEADAAGNAEAVLKATSELYRDAQGEISTTVDPAIWDQMSSTLHQAGLISRPVPAAQSLWRG